MARGTRAVTVAREVDGWLSLASSVERAPSMAVIHHVASGPSGELAVSVAHLPRVRDTERLLHALAAGKPSGDSFAPGALPTNIPGHSKPSWRASWPSDIVQILREQEGVPEIEALRKRVDTRTLLKAGPFGSLSAATYREMVARPAFRRDVLDLLDRHPWLLEGIGIDHLVELALRPEWSGILPSSGDAMALALLRKGVWRVRHDHEERGWPISMRAVRAIAGLSGPDAVRTNHLQFLSALPPDWVPRPGTADWTASRALARMISSSWCRDAADVRTLLAGSKGDFAALERRLVADLPDSALWREVGYVDDLFSAFGRDVSRPVSDYAGIWTDRDRATVAKAFLGIGTLASAVDVSRRWHAQERGIRLSIEPSDRRVWAALTKPFRSRGKLDVVALTSAAELDAEGRHGMDEDGVEGLHHCVAGRADGCARGDTHVLSVRRSRGRSFVRLSTAEVDLSGGKPAVVEHRGRLNQDPPREAVEALAEWEAAVKGGKLALDERALRRLERRSASTDTPEQALARSIPAWSGLMRRRYRYLDPLDAGIAALEAVDRASINARAEASRPGKPY